MPQTCSVCRHPEQNKIDQALLTGEAYRGIAKRFAASPAAVFRHGKEHVPKALVKAREAETEVQAETLFQRLRALNGETQAILRAARESQNHVIALNAIGRAEKQLELEARLLGELDNRTRLSIGISVGAQSPSQTKLTQVMEGMTPEELTQFGALLNRAAARLKEG